MREADDVAVSMMWFRRDLRVTDHAALAAAAAAGRVVPVFVVDPRLYEDVGAVRQRFLVEALRSLGASMHGSLVIRHGAPTDVVPQLAAELRIRDVFVTADHAPAGRRRDEAVHHALKAVDARLVRVGSNYAVTPGSVKSGASTPYAVFTPFRKAWRAHGWDAPIEVGGVDWFGDPHVRCDGGPQAPELTFELASPTSEQAALDHLHEFAHDRLAGYKATRDLPAVEGTSRLGAALHFGLIHPRTILAATDAGEESSDTFVSEIAWREFYADVLFHQPNTAWKNLQSSMNTVTCDTDDAAHARFDRWCSGTTGYPIVDAGMRQLRTTGWMHNRVRMITASFLVKDLHLPWQWGARHFLRHLVDGDVASNNHGWQWAAGTGTDAAPYYRVFNPVLQGQRFDPAGEYVRRFVPELADSDSKFVHAPWQAPTPLPGYGAPMIDHAVERDETLRRYAVSKALNTAQSG
jgi:deoxyribodipyrimidine photo-lyase